MTAVEHWSTYVGNRRAAVRSLVRFADCQRWFGQIVVVTNGGIDVRDRLKDQFEGYLRKTFPGTDAYVKLLEVGPPVGRPVQYRLAAEHRKGKGAVENLAAIVRSILT